jgi:hypothetical protein
MIEPWTLECIFDGHMKMLAAFALLGSLTGCPSGSDDSGADPDPTTHVEPTIFGPDHTLLGDHESVVLDWIDESSGKCTPFDPCHTDSFVIDEVTCDGCALEVFVQPSGAGKWVPAQGFNVDNGSVSMRLTSQTVGDKTLRVVVRSTEHATEIVRTLELRFRVDRVPGIVGTRHTGHRDRRFQITGTPCSTVRVAGDSLYAQPALVTASGTTPIGREHT